MCIRICYVLSYIRKYILCIICFSNIIVESVHSSIIDCSAPMYYYHTYLRTYVFCLLQESVALAKVDCPSAGVSFFHLLS